MDNAKPFAMKGYPKYAKGEEIVHAFQIGNVFSLPAGVEIEGPGLNSVFMSHTAFSRHHPKLDDYAIVKSDQKEDGFHDVEFVKRATFEAEYSLVIEDDNL